MTTVEQFITRLRQQVQLDIQHSWHDVTLLNLININSKLAKINLDRCSTASVNDKGYIVFPQGRQVKWLAQKITIPQTLQGYSVSGLSLRLVLTWWAQDAQIFINGELIQQGDLFDSSARVLITENARSPQEYLITICLVSPHHDIGALMRSHLIYEQQNSTDLDPGLVADELAVLHKYISQFEPEHLDILATELDNFSWHNLGDADGFESDLAKLRSRLLPLAQNIKQRCFNLLGHAHLDMAWLWTTEETYEVAERTFKSVLSLQQDFPDLTFGHTSPALYQWLEKNRPQLFTEIKQAVELNKWEILGGMWIEPETNLVGGESLIRQLLYGQQYYQSKFGQITPVAWLPDSFGFTWQLPQIMQQCGIEYFVTGKLHWNDTTKFPFGCFWWESPDGTQLLTLMSPPNVTGVMDTNPMTMTDYAIDWETQTGLQEIFWLPGVGDHGGGPTRDMLEVAQKWQHSPFFPDIRFSTASDYLKRISGCNNHHVNNSPSPHDAPAYPLGLPISPSPVWKDELYLELHRGSYTAHGDQKQYNRYCERLLYQGELWLTLATLLCGDEFVSQPLFPNVSRVSEKGGLCQGQQLIEVAWKKVLFNQFHDILPGTSIAEVFTEANRDWEAAIEIGEKVLRFATEAIASSIELPAPPQPDARPVVLFNSLNWQRSAIVTVGDRGKYDRVCDLQGKAIACQIDSGQLHFSATIPSVGYCVYWLVSDQENVLNSSVEKQDFVLENEYLTVSINSLTGDLDSIYDRKNDREILSGAGNQLQAFTDKGQYWDAWNIDPEYEQKQLEVPRLQAIAWMEHGELRQRIRVTKQLNKSQFVQDYILENSSPILKIANTVDWQETQVMVKVAFPLKLNSDRVSYEIPCGVIERTTKPQTEEARAKWEVSGLNWADLTDNNGEYGVSLLNDCKYGYDAQSDRLRLTLLRSPLWPDPQSDRGIHHFTYAIYPHLNSWQEALTVQKAYELNTQIPTVAIERRQPQEGSQLPPISELLNLSAANLILTALKMSENRELILRCYEAHGREAIFQLKSDLNLQPDRLLDCLERITARKINQGDQIEPYKIITLTCTQKIKI
ncbi:alpha-mannosidase [Pleurocapsales cyanobacterium LEGE 10410]|nr:alpha-mannosidase [Pleurocapsales cyanobacterium LEGE 10410]